MLIRFLSAQPATDYYAWQVEVYLHNFLKLGYDSIDVVGAIEDGVPLSWQKLRNKFKTVNFYFYISDMPSDEYPPAIQSHILSKHFKQHKYLKDYAIFFHDCDFIFTKYFDFSRYLHDNTWYFSDTISYIGAEYIRGKGEEVLEAMCGTIGIEKEIVINNQKNSGGAQKLMKNLTSEYWDEVYRNSINLYRTLKQVKDIKKEGDPNGIQIWTASMWSELWTAWKRGYHIEVPKEFDFAWATCPSERWNDVYFFHNAGVPNSNSEMFFKADYIDRLPYLDNIKNLNKKRCSYKYYQLLKSIDSCLI